MIIYGVYYYFIDDTTVYLFTLSDSLATCKIVFDEHFILLCPHINNTARAIYKSKECIVWINVYQNGELFDTNVRQPYHNIPFHVSD
jgi:hypothetical protein